MKNAVTASNLGERLNHAVREGRKVRSESCKIKRGRCGVLRNEFDHVGISEHAMASSSTRTPFAFSPHQNATAAAAFETKVRILKLERYWEG